MRQMGWLLIVGGAALVVAGVLFLLASRFPSLGHLPGDVNLKGRNWSFHFPLATCIIASIILTLLLNLISRLFRK